MNVKCVALIKSYNKMSHFRLVKGRHVENMNIQKLNELSDLMEPISPQKPFGRFVSLPNRQMFKVFARILFLLGVTAKLTPCVTFNSTKHSKCARLHRLYFPDTKYLGRLIIATKWTALTNVSIHIDIHPNNGWIPLLCRRFLRHISGSCRSRKTSSVGSQWLEVWIIRFL